MLEVRIDVDAPACVIDRVRESLAEYLDQFGDARVVSVTERRAISAQERMPPTDKYWR